EAMVVVLRDHAEYASVALRAADIASRINGAVQNVREHGHLLVLVDWSHGRPLLHQASRDGTIDYPIAHIVSEDLGTADRHGDPTDLVQLARLWLDRIDVSIEAALAADRPFSGEEPAAAGQGPAPTAAPVPAPATATPVGAPLAAASVVVPLTAAPATAPPTA